MSSKENFKETVNQAVQAFISNKFCQLVDKGNIALKDYHAILLMLFH